MFSLRMGSAAAALLALITLASASPDVDAGPKKGDPSLLEPLNSFSLSILRDVEQREKGNVVVFTTVTGRTIGLVGSGATGDALKEFKSLGFTGVGRDTELGTLLNSGNADLKFNFASALVVRKDVKVDADFIALGKKAYGTRVFKMPEKDQAEVLNTWARKTGGKDLADVIDQTTCDKNPLLVILSAAYVEGQWESQFYSNKDYDADFTLTDGKKVTVKYMASSAKFQKADLKAGTAVRVPVKGKASAIFLLPKEKGTVKDLLAEVTAKNLPTLFKDVKSTVKLDVPPTKLRASTDLIPPMKALGLKQLFVLSRGNFDYMLPGVETGATGYRQVASLDIDHKGFRGGAAEAMTFGSRGVDLDETVKLNRPFAALIVDEAGVVMVVTVVRNPTLTK